MIRGRDDRNGPLTNRWDDPDHEDVVSFDLGLAEVFDAEVRDAAIAAATDLLGAPIATYDGRE